MIKVIEDHKIIGWYPNDAKWAFQPWAQLNNQEHNDIVGAINEIALDLIDLKLMIKKLWMIDGMGNQSGDRSNKPMGGDVWFSTRTRKDDGSWSILHPPVSAVEQW